MLSLGVYKISGRTFNVKSPSVKQGLGVATGLIFAFEDEIQCGLVGAGVFEVIGHFFIVGVASILLVHYFCHALESALDLSGSDHAMLQPVGNVLA